MGTRELLAVELLARHGTAAQVVAAGTAWTASSLLMQVLIALVFTRRANAILSK